MRVATRREPATRSGRKKQLLPLSPIRLGAPEVPAELSAAGRADETDSASPSAETVETFRAFRRALVLKFKTPDRLQSEAFDFIYDPSTRGGAASGARGDA